MSLQFIAWNFQQVLSMCILRSLWFTHTDISTGRWNLVTMIRPKSSTTESPSAELSKLVIQQALDQVWVVSAPPTLVTRKPFTLITAHKQPFCPSGYHHSFFQSLPCPWGTEVGAMMKSRKMISRKYFIPNINWEEVPKAVFSRICFFQQDYFPEKEVERAWA